MSLLNDLLIHELIDNISRVHIDGNDSDDLDADLEGEVTSDTTNEFGNSSPDQC